MKTERIQERLLEKPDWSPVPVALERRWSCKGFLEATRLARIAERTLADSLVAKEITLNDHEVRVRLSLEEPVTAEALFETRDRLDAAADALGG